jgi:hypothetical protein
LRRLPIQDLPRYGADPAPRPASQANGKVGQRNGPSGIRRPHMIAKALVIVVIL